MVNYHCKYITHCFPCCCFKCLSFPFYVGSLSHFLRYVEGSDTIATRQQETRQEV